MLDLSWQAVRGCSALYVRQIAIALGVLGTFVLASCGSDEPSQGQQNPARAGASGASGSTGTVEQPTRNPASGGSAGARQSTGGSSSASAGSGGSGGDSAAGAANGGATAGGGSSGGDPKPAPPEELDDWVRGHSGTKLIRHDYDNNVALYVDENVDTDKIDWVMPFATKALQYMKDTYDPVVQYGPDHLYVFLHEDQFGGGTISSYFDDFSDFRNAVDNGSSSWARGTNIDIISHEMAHIVEGSSNGIHESPAFVVWKDSKWAEIFQYDLYLALGMKDDAERVFQKFTSTTDSFPRANTRWFRDWFYPLWRDHGGAKVLANFFRQLAEHFPTRAENDGRNQIYSRRMNLGELVHFYSGAAGKDLTELAEKAFGSGFTSELTKARSDFPDVDYDR